MSEAVDKDGESQFRKAVDAFRARVIAPYFKIRDFNNGPDTGGENRPHFGMDVGVKITF